MNYQIGDFIIRIKNAAMARRRVVELPYSKLNKSVGEVLKKQHFLEEISEDTKEGNKILVAKLKYEKRMPVFTDVVLLSKPSLRVYGDAQGTFARERNRMSTIILSTSKGVMTGKDARKNGVGGEYLFEIW